ncbi:MAG TPA: ABC transporter ATP-binding protein [Symbiobacteriaceae bacterium]
MQPDIVLETVGVSKSFGGVAANQGISIKVPTRTLRTVIGPNGAGKTTLFNLISGIYRPTAGRIYFKGEEITGLPPHQIARRGIGRSFQMTNLFPDLSALENARLAAQARGRHNWHLWRQAGDLPEYRAAAEEALETVAMLDRAGVPARDLAHGEKRKLEIAILLAMDPELLLLDEPTAGMSREEVPGIIAAIERIRAQGKRTILMVEHKMDIVLGISDAITVLAQGTVIAEGKPAEITADAAVQAAYLGATHGYALAAAPAGGAAG